MYDDPRLISSIDNVYAVCKHCNYNRKANQSVEQYKDQKDSELIEMALNITANSEQKNLSSDTKQTITPQNISIIRGASPVAPSAASSTVYEPIVDDTAAIDLTANNIASNTTNTAEYDRVEFDPEIYEIETVDESANESANEFDDSHLFNDEEIDDMLENIEQEKHLKIFTDQFGDQIWTYRILLNTASHYVMDIIKAQEVTPRKPNKHNRHVRFAL